MYIFLTLGCYYTHSMRTSLCVFIYIQNALEPGFSNSGTRTSTGGPYFFLLDRGLNKKNGNTKKVKGFIKQIKHKPHIYLLIRNIANNII
jgi:hypothetical protein